MPSDFLSLLNSINQRAKDLVVKAAQDDRLEIYKMVEFGSANVFDFAIGRPGTIAAGLELAKICMAGLADVSLSPPTDGQLPLPRVNVATDFPLLACMAAQYAGWPLSTDQFFAMCSGPARSLRGLEDVLREFELEHSEDVAVGVLETNQSPPNEVIADFASDCSVAVDQTFLCIARTASFPGTLQVVARSVETAMHKLHELKFDLSTVKSGYGSAPLPPIAKDDLTALGWTNDAVLYGATVVLYVDTEDAAVEAILDQVPSSSSPDFGNPFANIFEHYDRDFYKIDKMLFSPAKIVFNNLRTGKVFQSGALNEDVLRQSFGIQ